MNDIYETGTVFSDSIAHARSYPFLPSTYTPYLLVVFTERADGDSAAVLCEVTLID
jgi:hypothetical protein